jgi:hypothetical protein
MKRIFEGVGQKRLIRKNRPTQDDSMPLSKRQLESTWLWPKALETLHKAKFKTTEKWGHAVSLYTIVGHNTWVEGKSVSWKLADEATVPKDRDQRIRDRTSAQPFAGKVQQVALHLNLVQWARVFKYRAQLVEGHMVTRVVVVKSPKQLVVQMLKQSTGYKIKIVEAEIRLGSDDLWRVVEVRP